MERFSRTARLIGVEGLEKLKNSRVAVFGIGGVGSYTTEALARAGVGHFLLVDNDTVCLTNLNRQLHATGDTVGRPKVEVMRERILSINPEAEVETIQAFCLPENAETMVRDDLDYLVDAVDTVTTKIDLIIRAKAKGIPVISSMGTGNKMHPELLEIADLKDTSVCPLARVMRKELRDRNILSVKVVYSREQPLMPLDIPDAPDTLGTPNPQNPPDSQKTTGAPGFGEKRQIPGSISFVPSTAGLLLASVVVNDLLKNGRGNC